MPVTSLNHYFVRANNLEATRAFYCDILGFDIMPRPDFPFPGYWLGTDGQVQVHMGPHGIDNADLYYLGSSGSPATDNSGVVDHIAFLATEPEAMLRHCASHGVATRKRYFPEFKLFQIFVVDPDGITIELNYHGVEEGADWLAGGENYADMPRA
jgi:catechol 2,3-dioxygenase-like lactoylglutathione lyase family enzyme